MSSRREQKEKLRQERLAREQAETKQTARRRRMQILAGAGGALIVVAAVVVISLAGGGSASGDVQYASGSVPAGAEVGVTAKPPPWPPNNSHLAQRLSAMGLPKLNEQIFHVHAAVRVYVNGKNVTIPPNMGLDQATRTYSPLHTHDTTGVIHEEADRQYDFTVGQLFAVWGVKFSNDQIGPYKAGGGKVLEVYDNGTRATDPVNLVMQAHDAIVVGYGKPGSFPTSFTVNWPPGL